MIADGKTAFELAKHNNIVAKAEHVTALAVQKSEMEASHAHMVDVLKRAPQEKQDEIDSAMASAVIYEESGSADHTRHTEAKEVECNAERAMLKDERDTIKLARTAIGKMTAVRDNNGDGAEHDYVATTTAAPTWERL